MATLTYSHFGNHSRSHPCAHYTIRSTQESMKRAFLLLYYSTIVLVRASANWVAAARRGWQPHAFRGGFFDFIYVFTVVIGTCMQNFKKIDLKKNSTFLFKTVVHCFCCKLYTHTHTLTHSWGMISWACADFAMQTILSRQKISPASSIRSAFL